MSMRTDTNGLKKCTSRGVGGSRKSGPDQRSGSGYCESEGEWMLARRKKKNLVNRGKNILGYSQDLWNQEMAA